MTTSNREEALLNAHVNDTSSPTRAVALVRKFSNPKAPTLMEQLSLCELFCRENNISLDIIITDDSSSDSGLSTRVLDAYKVCEREGDIAYLTTFSPAIFGPAFTDFAAFQLGFRELDTLLVFTESHPPLCKGSPHPHETARSRPKTKDRPQVSARQ